MSAEEFFRSVREIFSNLDRLGYSLVSEHDEHDWECYSVIFQSEFLLIRVVRERFDAYALIKPSFYSGRWFPLGDILAFFEKQVALNSKEPVGPPNGSDISAVLRWFARKIEVYNDQIVYLFQKDVFLLTLSELAEWCTFMGQRRMKIIFGVHSKNIPSLEFFRLTDDRFRHLMDQHGFSLLRKEDWSNWDLCTIIFQSDAFQIRLEQNEGNVAVKIRPAFMTDRWFSLAHILAFFVQEHTHNSNDLYGPPLQDQQGKSGIQCALQWYADKLVTNYGQIRDFFEENIFAQKQAELTKWVEFMQARRVNILTMEAAKHTKGTVKSVISLDD